MLALGSPPPGLTGGTGLKLGRWRDQVRNQGAAPQALAVPFCSGQAADEAAGASEAAVAATGVTGSLVCRPALSRSTRAGARASGRPGILQSAWPGTGQLPALGSSPLLANLPSVSVEWAYKTSCLKGLRRLNGIKVMGDRIWCLQSTPRWLSF